MKLGSHKTRDRRENGQEICKSNETYQITDLRISENLRGISTVLKKCI